MKLLPCTHTWQPAPRARRAEAPVTFCHFLSVFGDGAAAVALLAMLRAGGGLPCEGIPSDHLPVGAVLDRHTAGVAAHGVASVVPFHTGVACCDVVARRRRETASPRATPLGTPKERDRPVRWTSH